MKCFNGFCKDGVIQASTVDEILKMMGLRVQKEVLDAIISEVDEDGKNAFFTSNHHSVEITEFYSHVKKIS